MSQLSTSELREFGKSHRITSCLKENSMSQLSTKELREFGRSHLSSSRPKESSMAILNTLELKESGMAQLNTLELKGSDSSQPSSSRLSPVPQPKNDRLNEVLADGGLQAVITWSKDGGTKAHRFVETPQVNVDEIKQEVMDEDIDETSSIVGCHVGLSGAEDSSGLTIPKLEKPEEDHKECIPKIKKPKKDKPKLKVVAWPSKVWRDKRHLSELERAKAIELKQNNWSWERIARRLGKSARTIRNIWDRFQKHGTHKKAPKRPHHRVTTAKEDELIIAAVMANPGATSKAIKEELNLVASTRTIRKRLQQQQLVYKRPSNPRKKKRKKSDTDRQSNRKDQRIQSELDNLPRSHMTLRSRAPTIKEEPTDSIVNLDEEGLETDSCESPEN